MERFVRNARTISKADQAVIEASSVLVIGLGGLGSHVVEGLTRIGFKKIGICDFDIIATSNLNRQMLALEENIGQFKTVLAKERINAINSEVAVRAYGKYPNAQINQDLQSYDLVIDCLDNIKTRLLLEEQCLEVNVTLIYGTIAGNYGYYGVINRENPLIDMQENIENSLDKKLGNPYYIVACVSAMQILLALKVILKQEYLKNGFYIIDLTDLSIEAIALS